MKLCDFSDFSFPFCIFSSGAFVLLEAGCISQITVCKKRLSGPEEGIWHAECELPVGRVRIDRSQREVLSVLSGGGIVDAEKIIDDDSVEGKK